MFLAVIGSLLIIAGGAGSLYLANRFYPFRHHIPAANQCG